MVSAWTGLQSLLETPSRNVTKRPAVLGREYWANKATQITADAPSEAELHPELWGHVRFHPERLAAFGPTAKKKDKSVEDLLNDLK